LKVEWNRKEKGIMLKTDQIKGEKREMNVEIYVTLSTTSSKALWIASAVFALHSIKSME